MTMISVITAIIYLLLYYPKESPVRIGVMHLGERRRVIKGQAMRSGEEYRIPGSSMRGRRPGQRGGSRERGTRGTSKRGKKFINQ